MLKAACLSILIIYSVLHCAAQEKNFTARGEQITRFDKLGNAIDAHDGKIAYFDGTYYLYGTSYDCGFEWGNKTAPFCGFKVYTSKDMVSWADEGFLFDAATHIWQERCDGKTYGCFRPHVIYNRKNNNYVLWINVYDNVTGYRVFTSQSPKGPFIEVPEPKLAINNNMPAAGLNNGDHDLFVDDDGTAYLALTDWRARGAIAIEQLTDDYLSGTGKVAEKVTDSITEAPALFKRKGIYYITYSDPNCGYCSGTGTSYKTSASPLGPWSKGEKISDNSCGGQPSFVSTIKLAGDTLFLYGSDLWNNAAKNEALANYYWAPLVFDADGAIKPIDCLAQFYHTYHTPYTGGGGADADAYKAVCDITVNAPKEQLFTVNKTGILTSLSLPLLKSGYPNKALTVSFYEANRQSRTLLKEVEVDSNTIGWSAKMVNVRAGIKVNKSKQYVFVLHTTANTGCYGYAKGLSSSVKTTGIKFIPNIK